MAESHKGHLAGVVVPVVLLVLIVAILTTWQLRRKYSQQYLVCLMILIQLPNVDPHTVFIGMKQKRGRLTMWVPVQNF